MTRPLKIAVIAGEESGDLLAANLVEAIRRQYPAEIELIGVGGQHLEQIGLQSLFPMEDIALMGLAQVIKKLPLLLRHIQQTAAHIMAVKPDCLIVVDAPDFTHRVSAKVKAKLPDLPIIQYVAPSVWAWRPSRAIKMRRFIDHLLVVLPFEVEALQQLGGPPASYVGHPLLFNEDIIQARMSQKTRPKQQNKHLVLLPGSRHAEIVALMPLFGEAVGLLAKKIPDLHITLPTLPRLAREIEKLAQNWPLPPQIVTSQQGKAKAFALADVALAASGTVSLELALAFVPMVLCYKADWFAKHFILPKITIWSAALPNIITDTPIVPEYYNEFIRPAMLARQLYRHMIAGSARQAQLEGFDHLLQIMQSPLPRSQSSGGIGSQIILDLIARKQCGSG